MSKMIVLRKRRHTKIYYYATSQKLPNLLI